MRKINYITYFQNNNSKQNEDKHGINLFYLFELKIFSYKNNITKDDIISYAWSVTCLGMLDGEEVERFSGELVNKRMGIQYTYI